ncbi:chondroitin AC lyase [Nonomuraea solani]|uniref:Chondroitin AC lyase n=1 Tax=Nonomuraea solani TaxID=1144553 RepID=A0A1H6ED56_9ACTN|nr:polysaccharide lyase family 8 super-sandwich domain-containing protein [Nonomuraea solani]SEG95730.1 chondroitin AC lyase [Nonomuraea solani]
MRLRLPVLLALALLLPLITPAQPASAERNVSVEEDISVMTARARDQLISLGDDIHIWNGNVMARASQALDYVASLRPDGSWADVDYADRTNSANGATWKPSIALSRMNAIAQAYRTPNHPGADDPALLDALNRSLVYWERADPGGRNWWDTEVGESMVMGRVSLLTGDRLAPDALDLAFKHNTGIADPIGANGSWRTQNYLFEALSRQDPATISTGLRTMAKALAVNHTGSSTEAVQVDGSFWAHGAQLYSEGYGMILFNSVAIWADLARETSFAFTRAELDAVADYILGGTRWMVRREFGLLYLGYRPARTVQGVSTGAAEFIVPLQAMIRTDALNAAAYQRMLDNIMGTAASNGTEGNKYFWRSEFSGHARPGYSIYTRLNSARTVAGEYRSTLRPEIGNEIEWNSAGATAIQVDGDEYTGLFPVFDWYQYPGVTNPYQLKTTAGVSANAGTFVGGVSDGRYGATTLQLDKGQTKGTKSYFTFDDEMVALGADISSSATGPVYTTLNQAVARGTTSVDGAAVPHGTDRGARDGATWAYNDKTGYVMPDGGALRVSSKARTGSWIGHEPVSRNVFTLYVDHGVKPGNAGYAYIVLPGASEARTRAYARQPAVRVLRNDADVQAVTHAGLGRTMAVFTKPGTLDLGNGRTLSADRPSLVMLDGPGSNPKVTASVPDVPGATLTVTLTLTRSGKSRYAVFELGSGAELGKPVTQELTDTPDLPDRRLTAGTAVTAPALAGDGDPATSWRSDRQDFQWLRYELPRGSLLTGVRLTWGRRAATRYVVQSSLDGVTWKDHEFVTNGTGAQVNTPVAGEPARFARVLMLSGRGGYDVAEMSATSVVNLAQGRPAGADGSTGDRTPAMAVDGSMSTRWQGLNTDSTWLRVDLGARKTLRTVRLSWESAFARQYALQVSDDGTTWTDVYRTPASGSDGGPDVLPVQATGRHLRVQTLQRDSTQYGPSLWEIEAFAEERVPGPPAPSRENLALNRPVTVDSSYADAVRAALVNDGNATTRWASQREDPPITPRWVQVDLGRTRPVSQVKLLWEAATATDYTVKISADGVQWTEFARVRKPQTRLTDTIGRSPLEARYVRVEGVPATRYGLSIWELEVYSGYDLSCEPTTLETGRPGTVNAHLTPWTATGQVRVEALGLSVSGPAVVGADGRIEIPVTAGPPGSAALLLTHTGGPEYALCYVDVSGPST